MYFVEMPLTSVLMTLITLIHLTISRIYSPYTDIPHHFHDPKVQLPVLSIFTCSFVSRSVSLSLASRTSSAVMFVFPDCSVAAGVTSGLEFGGVVGFVVSDGALVAGISLGLFFFVGVVGADVCEDGLDFSVGVLGVDVCPDLPLSAILNFDGLCIISGCLPRSGFCTTSGFLPFVGFCFMSGFLPFVGLADILSNGVQFTVVIPGLPVVYQLSTKHI